MTTATILRNALSALHTVFPSAVATVGIDGVDVAGLIDGQNGGGNLTTGGTDAERTGSVRVRSDLIRALKIGESITVNGQRVYVTQDDTDPAGIVRNIGYSIHRPYTGDEVPL